MKYFAVIGNPIAHSLSPVIHQKFSEQTGIPLMYKKILAEDENFTACVRDFFDQGGTGLNITAPFKRAAFELAENKTDRCQAAQAANTLWKENGQICADNTDGIGLVRDLSRYINLEGCSVLILGAGGAAQGVIPALHAASVARISVHNRTAARAENLSRLFDFIHIDTESANKFENYDIIVNATSLSARARSASALSFDRWLPVALCYDISYDPNGLTPFVLSAQRRGIKACDGLGMLVEQAAEAFFDWHGILPETQSVLRMLRP